VLADDTWVPRDADVVKLETFFGGVRIGNRHTRVKNGYSATRLFGQHLGSCGYVLCKGAAGKLLTNTRHLKAPVDLALFSPNQMTAARNTTYQLTPALCAQAHFVSGERPASLIQLVSRVHVTKPLINRISVEATRTFGLLRNRAFFATEKVDAVPLRFPLARSLPLGSQDDGPIEAQSRDEGHGVGQPFSGSA
jgi:glycosyl transferase family 25